MELSFKQKVVAVIVYTAVAVAIGRFSSPEKVKIEKETTQVDTSSENKNNSSKTDTNRDTHIETTRTERITPDGTTEVVTKTVKDSKTDRTTKSVDKGTLETSKTEIAKESKLVESKSGGVDLSFLGLVNANRPQDGFSYGLSTTVPILGPINIQAIGTTNGTVGLGLGLRF